jgi:regulatory associated protein of mTOR
VSAALCLCLNIGVDPPDVVKTYPCAKLECWIDPESLPGQRALEKIGKNLQEQYETLSMRTRYRLQLDPSIEDAKRFCQTMRRTAKEERVLFHYNGHGVPKPTSGGEIWVFNRNFTQYIPVPIYDFMGYLGTPCLYVWDCSAAGHIIDAFKRFAEQRDTEAAALDNAPKTMYIDCIHLAACQADETLPLNPDLPADLFTSCLTTPIDMALRVFILRNPLLATITVEQVKKIPGRTSDRKSPQGELYWIFTSVTDTIAWSVLPRPLFKKLFRQDLMVAALFRNFLLADRIMREYNCHPISDPGLPETHNHPMWEAWDLAVDQCLSQMPDIVAKAERQERERAEKERTNTAEKTERVEQVELYQPGTRFSTFFEEQLTAFEVCMFLTESVSL